MGGQTSTLNGVVSLHVGRLHPLHRRSCVPPIPSGHGGLELVLTPVPGFELGHLVIRTGQPLYRLSQTGSFHIL
jgi:hypothetical protein